MNKFLYIALSLCLAACANPHKAKDIDTTVDISAPVNNGGVIGVKDGDMVYQRKVIEIKK